MNRFPYSEDFVMGDRSVRYDQVTELLTPHLSQTRRDAIERVIKGRTYSITAVCDNLYDLGNVAAVMRSAEAMGIQSLHLVRRQEKMKMSQRITAGTDKWLDIHKWDGPTGCIDYLRERGYAIVATQLSDDCVPIGSLDFSRPTAIVFGNERAGVSEDILAEADARCIIPIRGFAESFNISVAAALSFYHITRDREMRGIEGGDLSEHELDILRAEFYRRGHKHSETIVCDELRRLEGEAE